MAPYIGIKGHLQENFSGIFAFAFQLHPFWPLHERRSAMP